MYCSKCRRRGSCAAICEKLEAHLKSREVYQRETCLNPNYLTLVADTLGVTWSDLLPDSHWVWDRLGPYLDTLPAPLLRVFMLHFYEGRGVVEISRRLRLNRSTVNRRLQRAIQEIRNGVARGAASGPDDE